MAKVAATTRRGQRMLDVPRALLLFHDGHGTYDVLVEVPPADVPDAT
ncbi:hypothetical protein [Nannocystis pusilla]|uniref:Uncharacterized protein n=1 Tax=Nannocystis pusilla TaxID=889268 RepID=A0ABS7TXW2_9BACT|nr:hypothetical protein [Nannocystis pusilla]MBZ5712991.1 hypothetical protein [Nannocystis pusilla]